ncbi:MAG: metallophosphoesterase [Chloroflexota bacterium]
MITPTSTVAPTTTAEQSPTIVPTRTVVPTPTPLANSVTLVGAGDIASCSSSGDEATAALLDQIGGAVFTTGDNAYERGTATEFQNCYEPSWGRHKADTHPIPGNHEWLTANAQGYRDYFGFDGAPTWYSYNQGAWHVVVLDSDCVQVAGCGIGSPQYAWLATDLTENTAVCTVAMWHHARFSSGKLGIDVLMSPIWRLLYDHDAELVLSGHDHDYERFAPQTANGQLDIARGLRQFVVGTGGVDHTQFARVLPNSEVRNADTFGVLKLTLRMDSYDWQFIPVAGSSFSDTGTGACH